MAKKDTTTPKSRADRFFKLAGMTASVAGRYAGNKLRSTFLDDDSKKENTEKAYEKMADDIADTLGELKGAVMKIGQIASQTQDFLPKEFATALQKLQKQAPPMDFSVIRNQLENELGKSIPELFSEFDEEVYAAASIGQVHRAVTLDGKEVIVKVQYPGVDASVDSDLKQLKLALKLGGLLKMPKESVDKLFNEIRARLVEELDYVQERKNLDVFRKFHARGEHKTKGIIIPKSYPKLCSKRVLTLEYVEGDHSDELDEKGYSQATRNLIGQRLFEMVAKQIFVLQKIHGDPHPGNFAFRPDGSVIVYDFGCIKELKEHIVEAYKQTIESSLEEDYQTVDQCLQVLGARVSHMPSPGDEYYKLWRDIFFEPFSGIPDYDYDASKIHLDVAKNTPLFMKHLQFFAPPVESMYIDRVLGGQYWMMKSIKVQQDFRPALDEYLA